MNKKYYLLSDINMPSNDDEVIEKQTGDKKYNIVAQATTFGDSDRMGDVIDSNAFNSSVKRINGGGNLKILLNHDKNMPLGNWTKAVKNEKGIKLYGYISQATERHKEILELVREKVYDKVSIGFIINKADSIANNGLLIKQGEMIECSIVSVPANNNANILSVKSYDEMMNLDYHKEVEIGNSEPSYNIDKQELLKIVADNYRITI